MLHNLLFHYRILADKVKFMIAYDQSFLSVDKFVYFFAFLFVSELGIIVYLVPLWSSTFTTQQGICSRLRVIHYLFSEKKI